MTYFNDKKAGDPKWIAGDDEHEEALAKCGVSVEAAWRIPGRPVRWLVENVIPDEAVTVIAGDAGSGKTFFACQLAADAARVSQCRVVLATSSYEAPELLRWRLDQADADTRRIAFATLTPPKGIRDRRLAPTDEEIDERMAVLYHTLLGAGDPTSGILPVEMGKAEGKRQKAEEEGQSAECNRQSAETDAPSRATRPHPGPLPEGEGDNCPLPVLPIAAELLVIDDVDGWFGKPGQCVSAAALARVIGRLNELARSLKVAIVVLVRAQMSVEGRITSRQLSRLSQSASVVWMVVRDREKAEGRPEGARQKAEEGLESDGECKMQNAKCKMQNDASGNNLAPEDPTPTTLDPRPKTSTYNLKSKIENPKSGEPLAYSQSDRRWLLPVKNNLAPDVGTFGRAFELFDGQIRWHGDDRAPSLAEATLPSVHNSDRRRLRHAAAVWLEEALAAGPLPSKELYRQGVENGFSQGTLKRAATELGIFPHKTGFEGGWEMRWTPQPVVRGRGTTARSAGVGFKIFGGDDEIIGQGETGTRGRGIGQGDKETRGQGEAVAALNSSCAPSTECEETEAASCASSAACEEIDAASCASSPEREEIHAASCASSAACEEIDAASCASSPEREEIHAASCTSSTTADGNSGRKATCPHPGPGFPLAGAEGEGEGVGNPKSQIENPKCRPANPQSPAPSLKTEGRSATRESGDESHALQAEDVSPHWMEAWCDKIVEAVRKAC